MVVMTGLIVLTLVEGSKLRFLYPDGVGCLDQLVTEVEVARAGQG